MNLPPFDLQSHSTCSDGELSPSDTVRAAHAAGVELLALTDHDTVEGVAEAQKTADALGLRLVASVEMSVLDPTGGDLHICGYAINPRDETLNVHLAESRQDRERRIDAMAEAVRALGWSVDDELLQHRRADGSTIGRPHLAQAVAAHKGNAQRLRNEGLEDPSAFLVAYLVEGKPGFQPRDAPSAAEAISLIHGAGGVAVWAHPFWDIGKEREVISTANRFRSFGLDGLEVFYVTHGREQVELLHAYCARHGLLTTGSSDFHGPHHSRFNGFRRFSTYGLIPDLGPLAS